MVMMETEKKETGKQEKLMYKKMDGNRGQNRGKVITPNLDESLPDTDGPAASKGGLILVAVVAHGAILQHHVAVLPPVDIVGPF